MRTTINISEELVNKALKASHCRTKTALFTQALENLVQQSEVIKLKKFKGKLDLDIDLNQLRNRG